MNALFAAHPLVLVSLVKIIVLLLLLMTALAYITWFERKVVAHIQARWGPYRVGPHGLLQPVADGIKFLFKEDLAPARADKFVFVLAPFLTFSLAISSIALIPFGPMDISIFGQRTPLQVANVSIGLLFLFALSSIGVYGVALAGWSSNSKYSLLGGLRSTAQMVSYELTLTLSVVGVLLMAGTLNFREIIEAQGGSAWGFLHWNLFARPFPQLLGFICFFTAAIAETNRLPFDLPEAEGELGAGFHTEYSSFKFAMFFIGEYSSMVTVSCLATILFFGGWLSPFPDAPTWSWTLYIPAAGFIIAGVAIIAYGVRYSTIFGRILMPVVGLAVAALGAMFSRPEAMEFVQGPFWFLLKLFIFLFIYVWVRGTLPRFRYDQLMGLGWKILFPLALANVILTSLAVAARP
ncbi:MAG TPA: complex I subunit 1 family protein [Methylomirabilota bacterium]|nr:complex I subunit 1 family protein [Methylomirabilota bacterium]